MKELKVVIIGKVENIDTEQQKIQFNNKGENLDFWMVKEEIGTITTGQEIEVTLVIPCGDEGFSQLRGYIKKDVYDLLNIIKSLNIDLNTIDRRKYINIYEKKRTD